MAYDSPNNTVRREAQFSKVTGIASTNIIRMLCFQKTRIKKVHALCMTAGTDAAAGVDILNGTTSVGAITFGTDTAGTTYSSGALDSTITALSYLEIKGKAGSATMVHSYAVEYEVLPDSVQS